MPVLTPKIKIDPLAHRALRLAELGGIIHPIPESWLGEIQKRSRKSHDSSVLECMPCDNYKDLITAWRRAMKWTDGLDCALSCMLSSVLTTKLVGDQLWFKIVSPAACLHGSTSIYDPIDQTTKSVAERTKIGNRFHVYTLLGNGEIGITQAKQAERFPKASMYRITFASGKQITVTGQHRIWNGEVYATIAYVYERQMLIASPYPLVSISGTDLLARMQDAQHCLQTAEDFRGHYYAYSCPRDEQLLQGLGIYLDVSPSQADAQERNHARLCRDGQEREYECTQTCFSLLSSSNSYPLSESSQFESESGFPFSLDTYEQSGCLLSFASPYSLRMLQTDRSLSSVRSSLQTKEPVQHQHQTLLTPEPLLVWQHLESYSTEESNGTEDTDQQFAASSVLSKGAYAPVSSSRQPISDTFEQQADQRSSSYNIPQSSSQLHKDQQPTQSDFDPRQQPYLSSVNVSKLRLGYLSLTEVDHVVSVEYVGEDHYYDFHVPGTNNYWAEGFFHHNTGKSSLCEALSICTEYILAKSTLRGFHSGWKGDGEEDSSLLAQVRDKTFVTKDGDTLLQQPNLGQILAEGRDIYDRVSRSHYRNNAGKDYQGLSMTWLLCGTSSLRQIDHSELGERFLDCVIMEEIDDDLEDDILWRVANRVDRSMHVEVNHSPSTHYEPDMIEAMELTGGYVKYLRENAVQLVTTAKINDDAKRRCTRLAKFIAIMRARPSKTQAEKSGRELASRLCSQLTRLAKALVVVLNRAEVDDEVMKRVTKVALDTSRGHTLQMVDHLYRSAHGLDNRALALYINDSDERVRSLVRFLKTIRVLELNVFTPIGSKKPLNLWKLTDKMKKLYSQVEQA